MSAHLTKQKTAATPTRKRIVQNFILIWVDASIDQSKKDYQNTLQHLRSVVNDVNICTEPDQCIELLNGIDNEKAFLITSGSLGQHLIPNIHAMPQVDVIYIFCGNKSRHEDWAKKWTKIDGVHTDIKPICEALRLSAKQCNHNSVTMSFVSVNEIPSNENLDQLESSFMYTQMFKETLLEMKHDSKAINDFAAYCRKLHNDNVKVLKIIDEFERDYRSETSIWWYTRDCFIYQMLNRALRTLEGDTIINMGFFIRDLHHEIEKLHQKQINGYQGKSFVVYRGQGLSPKDFDKLQKTKGGLMSFNNFLSTSKMRETSLSFAGHASKKGDMVGVLFVMTIDPSITSTPFADIQEVSYIKEEAEILFSTHSVFRIGGISKFDNNNPVYEVNLKLTADDDKQLRILTERMREEAEGQKGWQRLGQLLLKLRQFDKAEELYNVLIGQTSDEDEKATYYNNLGCLKNDQGDYDKAIWYYQQGLTIWQKVLKPNHPSLATAYNNIGSVYNKMKDYSKALSFYEKSLEIWQKCLPPNHPDLATAYNNIGLLYRNKGDHSKAISYYEKALEIDTKTLPSNHPDLAISYNNIGEVYNNMGDYSKALLFQEKALEIQERSLPSNHPELATSYNNIAAMYYKMKEYSKALSCFERALDIKQRSLPPNHPSIQVVRDSIEVVKKSIK